MDAAPAHKHLKQWFSTCGYRPLWVGGGGQTILSQKFPGASENTGIYKSINNISNITFMK